jgi:FkbM family methyltransferase
MLDNIGVQSSDLNQRPSRALFMLTAVTRRIGSVDGGPPLGRLVRPLRGHLHRMLATLHSPPVPAQAVDAVVDVGAGLRMQVNTWEMVQRTIFLVGYEPEVMATVRSRLRQGQAAIDVGAHVGAVTLRMARSVAGGPVVACEPNPDLASRLRRNLELNQLTNVSVREVAVGARRGTATLHVPSDSRHVGGSSLASGAETHHHAVRPLQVPVVTLDDLVAEVGLRDVGLVKIDVEGYEADVLAGAETLLRRDRPALLFEYTEPWWMANGTSLAEVIRSLTEIGYATFSQLSWRGPVPIPSVPPTWMNVLAR